MISKLLALRRYPELMRLAWWRSITPWQIRKAGVCLDDKVSFFGTPIISMAEHSTIHIGARATLCSVSEFTDLGVNHPVVLRTLRPKAVIDIGEDTGISGATICAAIQVKIGRGCLLGANVQIMDTDFHSLKPTNRRYNNRPEDIAAAAVEIGDNVFIGTGALILKGVRLGDNAVIGAGAVVTRDVSPNAVVAGNPAVLVGHVDGVGPG